MSKLFGGRPKQRAPSVVAPVPVAPVAIPDPPKVVEMPDVKKSAKAATKARQKRVRGRGRASTILSGGSKGTKLGS